MKQQIRELLGHALKVLETENIIPQAPQSKIKVENTLDTNHGDFATNIALVLANTAKCTTWELANNIISKLPASDILEKTEIAGIGFINFFVRLEACQLLILEILLQKEHFGNLNTGLNEPLLLEFVSANPTGPLHIGHGRGAAYGAALANLLTKVGYDVSCEYYINDVGRQMDILAVSIWLRYLQQQDQTIPFPDNAYKGDYIQSIATKLSHEHPNRFIEKTETLLPLFDEEDPEIQLDTLIKHCIERLGEENYRVVFNTGLDSILNTIKCDLADSGVMFDNWFSEHSLVTNNTINKCIRKLTDGNWVYKKDGALWFRSSQLGDEKDRVLIRENGQPTYFASDIAYHLSKMERDYKKIINIWGADHHGYIARIKAAMQALGLAPEKLDVLLVQFATLYRGKEKLPMSTRSGEFITLKELQHEVGKDATRFFYIMRKSEQHLDFDLELAKSESNDNPVYYIQYAHARICSVFKQLSEKGYVYKRAVTISELSSLTEPHELKLMRRLARFTDVIENAARAYEPHQLAYYLKDLANDFHTYYNTNQFLVKDDILRNARLTLIDACRQVIKNALSILGISSPETM